MHLLFSDHPSGHFSRKNNKTLGQGHTWAWHYRICPWYENLCQLLPLYGYRDLSCTKWQPPPSRITGIWTLKTCWRLFEQIWEKNCNKSVLYRTITYTTCETNCENLRTAAIMGAWGKVERKNLKTLRTTITMSCFQNEARQDLVQVSCIYETIQIKYSST